MALYSSRFFLAALSIGCASAQYTLTTIAGGGPEALPATSACLRNPAGLALDAAGNLYIATGLFSNRVYKVDSSGKMTTLAGTGAYGAGGESVAATSSMLAAPSGLVVDAAGAVYVADTENHRVRKISGGIILTIAGTGTAGYNGDGIYASSTQLNRPVGLAVDSSGNLYIADSANHRVRRIAAGSGLITTVAGTGTSGYNGDGISAATANLSLPTGVATDTAGNLYIAEAVGSRVRKVAAAGGLIGTVAGTGTAGYSGDGGAATAAQLNNPRALVLDSSGNLYIADSGNHRIRKVAGSTISTVAGTGAGSFGGDWGPPTSAPLNYPNDVKVDSLGNLYICDFLNLRVRISTAGIIYTIVGNGTQFLAGDGQPAINGAFNGPSAVARDASGNFYVADTYNHRVRLVAAGTGIMTTFAGIGIPAFYGDGGQGWLAYMNGPTGVAIDTSNNLYIADTNNHRIRKVIVSTGIISTVAGNGTAGFSGDGGSATAAQLNYPAGLAVDSSGNLYIADNYNHRVRKISGGIITTVAGNGTAGYSGDGGSATAAMLRYPSAVAVDSSGAVYIADTLNHRIRKVSAGIITTVVGNGTAGYSGDGGAATSAQIAYPAGVALDSTGALYLADTANQRIRKVLTGTITTVAGTGTPGFNGDGAAASAQISFPTGLASDTSGNLTFADLGNQRVRTATPAITTASVIVNATPTGATLTVDGTSYTSPQTFSWTPGSSHTIGAVAPTSPPANTRYVFAQWSDSGAQTHTITPAAGSSTYTASFNTQVLISSAVSPAGDGAVFFNPTSSDGYYTAGSTLLVTASANSGYAFLNFSGLLTGTANPQSFTVAAPGTITANFTTATTSSVTVTAVPATATVVVDGTSHSVPAAFSWTAGSSHTIQAVAPASPPTNTRYAFAQWNDSGAQTHTITPASGSSTYTATFNTQVLISTAVSPSGSGSVALSPTSSDGYYNTATFLKVTASANSGYTFQNFSGLLTGTTNPQSFTVSAPGTVTANFAVAGPITYDNSPVTITGFTPLRVRAAATPYADPAGNLWAADTGFTGGSTTWTNSAILSTDSAPLYQGARWAASSLAYQWAVPNGSYNLRLRFAETTYVQAARRVMSVAINQAPALTGFDILAQAGGANAALDRVLPATVANGQLTLSLTSASGAGPQLNAIEILPPDAPYVVLRPSLATLAPSGSVQFTVDSSGDVTYTLTPNLGTLAGGLYTAPASLASPQTVTVTANCGGSTSMATLMLLPQAWQSLDIGAPNQAGSLAIANNTFTLKGAGDIGGASDDFRFAYQPFNGDGMLTARLWTGDPLPLRAGVMIRESTAADAPMAYLALWNGTTPMLATRAARAAGANTQYGAPTGSSLWLRLVRTGDTFAGYLSSDGVGWLMVEAPVTLPMAARALAGLAVGTGYQQTAQALFDQVKLESPTAVRINQGPASLGASQAATFTATVTGNSNSTVTWSSAPAAAGSINATSGVFNAAAALNQTPTVTITASSAADSAKSASLLVNLGAFQTVRLNAGGSAYLDPDGNVWSPDAGYDLGSSYSNRAVTIQNTAMAPLYQTQHTHPAAFSYRFFVPNGTYTVKLRFAEIGYAATGQRVFNVAINGTPVLSNFDITAQTGLFAALDRTFPVRVTNGQIQIAFTPVTGAPAINALEITWP